MDEYPLQVSYRVRTSADKVHEIAQEIAIEQTVEVTRPLWDVDGVRDKTTGKVVRVERSSKNTFDVTIAYPLSTTSYEIPQVLNVIYGNISLKRGIRVQDFCLNETMAKAFGGPRIGVDGIRRKLRVYNRPLVASAIKPIGRSIDELCAFARKMAKGGLDLIKDDHGFSNQDVAPFEKRVMMCASAVKEGAQKGGNKTLYFASITGPADEILHRALFAKACGADGVLLPPMIVSLDMMRLVRDKTGMIVMAHPALCGVFFSTKSHGISVEIMLGKLFRLCGADIVIFPSSGGRFPFTTKDCKAIVGQLLGDLWGIKKAFPCPAGGMKVQDLMRHLKTYGKDSILLIGSSLYEQSEDLELNTRQLMSKVNHASEEARLKAWGL